MQSIHPTKDSYLECKGNSQNITTNPILKWAENPNKHFSGETQMDNKSIQKWLISTAAREMKIQTTVRCHLTPVRRVILNEKHNAGVNTEKQKP